MVPTGCTYGSPNSDIPNGQEARCETNGMETLLATPSEIILNPEAKQHCQHLPKVYC